MSDSFVLYKIMEVLFMIESIGYIIAFIIVFGIPYHLSKKEESRKRRDMYNNLNKKSVDEMEKWRK